MSLSLPAIGAITLFVEDLEGTKTFYRRAFDVPFVFEDDVSAMFKIGETIVNLLAIPAARELIAPGPVASGEAGSRLQLTIWVDDVDAIVSGLQERGVQFLNGPMDREWGQRTACFADPAGHIWEIAQELTQT